MKAAVEIRVGMGSCGVASGAEPVRDALLAAAGQAGADGVVKAVGCNGMCYREPMVEVVTPDGRTTLYGNVSPETARAIAREHLRPASLVTRMRWAATKAMEGFRKEGTAAASGASCLHQGSGNAASRFSKQRRIVLENCGEIDPLRIDDYLGRGGYSALERCLKESMPEQIISAISESGLRGRGERDFPRGSSGRSAGHKRAPSNM